MELPNRDNAFLSPAKLTEYLLSESHPSGRSKAQYLRAAGFDENNVDLLEQGLVTIAQSFEVQNSTTTSHGTKYVIDGHMQAPSGNIIRLRTVWIIDAGHERPRFVTAYPE